MKLAKIIFSGIICFLLAGCIAKSPIINYKSNEVALNGIDSVKTKFFFTLQNPNALALNGNIDYNLYIEDQEFLSGESEQINAPANGETTFALQQDLSFDKIFGSAAELVNVIAKGQEFIKVRVSGQYRTKVLGFIELPVKLDKEIDVPLPTMKDIERELSSQLQQQLQNNFNLENLQNLFQ